jgi:hypothetical protein
LLEILTQIGLDPNFVIAGLALSAIVLILLYRRFFFSLFEPLSAFLMGQIGDATVMWAVPLALSYKWQFLAYMLCLWAGFALKAKPVTSGSVVVFEQDALFDLKFVLAALGLLIVVSNLYLGASAGFPLLSSDPSAVKETVYTGGLGIVRRVNMGPYDLFCSGCVLLIVANKGPPFRDLPRFGSG